LLSLVGWPSPVPPRLTSFARTSGGAIGLAVGNSILNNVFTSALPASLPAALQAELRKDFVLPNSLTVEVRNEILDAYMKGIKDVFILFVPIVGLCLVMCLFIKVRTSASVLIGFGWLAPCPSSQDISLNEPEAVAPPLPSEPDVEKGSTPADLDDRDKASSVSGATTPTTLCEVQEVQEGDERGIKTLPVVEK
jgi:hypothetical protein